MMEHSICNLTTFLNSFNVLIFVISMTIFLIILKKSKKLMIKTVSCMK